MTPLPPFTPAEWSRYKDALRRLSMNRVSPCRISRLANIDVEMARAAIRADPRYVKISRRGTERYELKAEYRHRARLLQSAESAD